MTHSDKERKQLRLLDAMMLIMGSMIGSGIFLAPALIAEIAVESRLGLGSFVFVCVVGGFSLSVPLCPSANSPRHFPELEVSTFTSASPWHRFWGFLCGWTLFIVIQTGFIAEGRRPGPNGLRA